MQTKKIIFFSALALSIFPSLCFGMMDIEEEKKEISIERTELNKALFSAVSGNKLELVKMFLEGGADINIRDCDVNYRKDRIKQQEDRIKQQALGEALIKAAERGKTKQVEKLLDLGADVNYQSTTGYSRMSALHRAANQNHPRTVLLLLSRGANPKIKDNHGGTPLHYAVTGLFKKSSEEIQNTNFIILLLRDFGANVTAIDRSGRDAYFIACRFDCDKSTLNLLQELTPLKKAPDVFCSICLGDETKDLCMLPVCKHIFHRECIGKWLAKNPICPHCYRSVTLEE